ncbi:MAG: PQQ-dependent sugar dehydrogenase [Euzebyaceae bacterium]|nr:PQQ-dependent sugar dehydrogenase [Euzebyaceae bacterium]
MAGAGLLAGCASGGGPTAAPSAAQSQAVSSSAPAAPTAQASAPPAPRSESERRTGGDGEDAQQSQQDLGAVAVDLQEVASLEQPTAMAVRQGDDTLFIAERTGRVVALRNGSVAEQAVLDLSEQTAAEGERGLLGIVFSPDGQTLYASYTNLDGDTRLDAYNFAEGAADPGSRRQLLAVDQPFGNHNGGNVAIGPDDLLYLGLGDGGSAGDPQANGQNRGTLLGKLLRIDPDGGEPYAIPEGNPFVDEADAQPEIYAYGLRNPWRFSFDRDAGDLWIADVGQGAREEIDHAPSGQGAGANYGWNLREGGISYSGPPPQDNVEPVFDYTRDGGRCSVTGGYVYRGDAIPGLRGAYLFSDYCDGVIRALRVDGRDVDQSVSLDVGAPAVVSFGQDNDGELYVLSLEGPVYRLVPG